MSKEIQLYSKDNKYKCAIELADSKDRFGCPDHSRIILFEERDDKIYLIADAKDKLLETEKDQRIAELEQELAELKEKAIVPKFSSGQIVYFANIVEGTVNKFNYIGEDKYNYVVEDKTGEVFIRMKERTFATEQEAQEKLKEIQGNE